MHRFNLHERGVVASDPLPAFYIRYVLMVCIRFAIFKMLVCVFEYFQRAQKLRAAKSWTTTTVMAASKKESQQKENVKVVVAAIAMLQKVRFIMVSYSFRLWLKRICRSHC